MSGELSTTQRTWCKYHQSQDNVSGTERDSPLETGSSTGLEDLEKGHIVRLSFDTG